MTMYVSLLVLNPRSALVQRDLANRYDLHRTLMSGFPLIVSPAERVLFRLEQSRQGVRVLVQSHMEPDWGQSERLMRPGVLLQAPWLKPYDPLFRPQQQLAFRLLANPTVKRQGKRHALLKEGEVADWLRRKAREGGFEVLEARLSAHERVQGRGEGRAMNWTGVQFDGLLRVEDAARFRQTIEDGIGSAKAFGFGLLSVAPLGVLLSEA